MLKLLATLIVALNPIVGFFAAGSNIVNDSPAITQEGMDQLIPAFTVPSANPIPAQKLPLPDDGFLSLQQLPLLPIRNWNIDDPDITAKTALIYDTGRQEFLFQKNGIYDAHPIASLTKLMTALVVTENAALADAFKISSSAVATEGEMGGLIVGETMTVKNLLYAMLVESSNDAAVALAENIPQPTTTVSGQDTSANQTQKFIDLMNQKARSLHLKNTFFDDPSGLSPQNYSCAWDVARLLETAIQNQLLCAIMQTKSIDVRSVDGRFNHHLVNTNKLLGVIPEIIGGKTGYTEEAGNCMVLAVRPPDNDGEIIIVVMDSKNRLNETKNLFEWTKKAYLW